MKIRRIAIILLVAVAIVIAIVVWKAGTTDVNRDAKSALSSIEEGGDEYTILVNRDYVLPADYVPEDLREVNIGFMALTHPERALMRDVAATALETLCADAAKEGLTILGVSGYRSYESQQGVYRNGSNTGQTDRYIARPGASEHQTGLVMDIGCEAAERLSEAFADTPEGRWVEKNAHRYGFIIRYPRDGEEITGYGWEPWHIRYVGKEAAAEIYESEQVLEMFLQK